MSSSLNVRCVHDKNLMIMTQNDLRHQTINAKLPARRLAPPGRTSAVSDKSLLSAIAVVVVIAERRDLCAQPRDGEVPDLERPAGIDRGLRAGKGQVERGIRRVDEFCVKAERVARPEQQAPRRAIL